MGMKGFEGNDNSVGSWCTGLGFWCGNGGGGNDKSLGGWEGS